MVVCRERWKKCEQQLRGAYVEHDWEERARIEALNVQSRNAETVCQMRHQIPLTKRPGTE